MRKYHQFFCGGPIFLAGGAAAPDAPLEVARRRHECPVGLVELQRVVAHLLAAEHRQRLEDQLAHVDVVQPVVEIERVVLPLEVAGEGRPLVDQLLKVGDVGRAGWW